MQELALSLFSAASHAIPARFSVDKVPKDKPDGCAQSNLEYLRVLKEISMHATCHKMAPYCKDID